MSSLETNQLLRAAADACDSRKAEDIRILALDPAESSLTDYFLICNGTNERQNVAISDEIEARLKKEFQTLPNSVEGRRQGEWVLMDYVDFVVHIFLPERRAYYGLEQLRKSATSLAIDDLDREIATAIAATRAKHAQPLDAEAEGTPKAKAAPRKRTNATTSEPDAKAKADRPAATRKKAVKATTAEESTATKKVAYSQKITAKLKKTAVKVTKTSK